MPQILNPGYAAVSELQDLLTQREVRKRQDFLDALEQKRVDAEIADHALNRKIQQENVDALAAQRKAAAVKTTADRLKPGQDITGTEAATTLPGDLTKTTGGATLPSTQISDAGRVASPSQPDASVPTTVEYTGTAQQRDDESAKQAILNDPTLSTAAKKIFLATGKIPESLLKPPTKPVVRVNPRTGKLENLGEVPADAHFVTEPKPDAPPDGGVALTPEGLDMAAKYLAKTGIMLPMGMGDKTTRKAIINRAGQYDPTTDSFPDKKPTAPATPPTSPGAAPAGPPAPAPAGPPSAPPDLASAKAGYRADTDSLVPLQKNYDAVAAFERTANKNAALLKDIIGKVPDTGVPLLNTPIRAIDAKLFGDENMAALSVLRQSVQNEYARLISQPNLQGVMSDSARKEVEALLSPDLTPKMMLRALDTLEKEATNRKTSVQEQIDSVKKRIGGKAPGVVAPAAKPTAAELIKKYGG